MDREPYGARFRRELEQPAPVEVLGDGAPSGRGWPSWLTRTGAGLAVAAAVTIAVWAGNDRGALEHAPAPAPDQTERYDSPVTVVRNTPPPQAPLTLTGAAVERWPTRGYSYVLELTNRTGVAYEVVDVERPVHGAEILWEDSLLLAANGVTTLTVDFLVVNCAAVAGRPAPVELRLILRPAGAVPGEAGSVAVMDLDLHDTSDALDAAGGVRCDSDRAVILSRG